MPTQPDIRTRSSGIGIPGHGALQFAPGSKYAKLDYEVLKYNKEINLSLLKILLHTGRHHQIRVQLAGMGHSICGDQKYGTRGRGKQISLWAYKLTIEHPITKESMR